MTEPLRDDDLTAPAPDAHQTADAGFEYADPDGPGPGMPPPTAVESLVNALIEAGPDVAEHVVKAAQELLLAVQAIVDAADRAVKEQQQVRADRLDEDEPVSGETEASVRHLDLAE
jgi:hypothetical protein